MNIKLLFTLFVIAFAISGCGKNEEPVATPTAPASAPVDDSASGRAKSAALAASAAKDRSEEHLARLREIAEKQEADRVAAEKKHQSFAEGLKKGGAAPIINYKY